MTRALLPYYNASVNGNGMEGLISYSSSLVSNLLVPVFLLVFYGLAIYIMLEKSQWKLGYNLFWLSFAFFILAMIAQTFVLFNQLFVFLFSLGMLVGIVVGYMENAK